MDDAKADLNDASKFRVEGPPPGAEKSPSKSFKPLSFILTVLLLVLLAASAVAAYLFYLDLQDQKDANKSLEVSLIEQQQKSAVFEQTAREKQEEVGRLHEQLKSYAAQRKELYESLQSNQKQIENFRTQIQALQNRANQLEREKRLLEQPPIPTTPEEPQAQPARQVEAAPIPKEQPVPEAVKTGNRILTVNRDYNFAIINLGTKDNVRIGDRFFVERGKDKVGLLEVEKLYENFSSASIVREPENRPLTEGDTIVPYE